ncbi:UDP-N-acetylmuramoyl-L-alanyl-D-glutamate--2,6-diaminopimelate ligase, partial [Streptomyces sp. SID7760]|nr:UDP-N-acetylmuramoyl-L-alanyl-D-glutamate--2,6-diaminopimelate ligase [Streptomyces sp. SID7760]
MTTITPKPGNPSADDHTAGPSLRERPAAPGTLTAVPHADQPRTTQQDAPATPPGAPRPQAARPTPLGELADLLGVEAPGAAPADAAAQPPRITGITHDSRAVRPGDLYAALPGAKLHGADFAAQ